MLTPGDIVQFLFTDKLQRTTQAVLDATRLQPTVNTVEAESALCRHSLLRIMVHYTVGATVYTELTAVAFFFVDDDDAVLTLGYGVKGAKISADGVIAMDTHGRSEVHIQLSPDLSWLYGDHPAGPSPYREIVLLIAGDLAGVAPDTFVYVY